MTTKRAPARAPRAAIYCRVSRDEQADNWSLPTQEAACRKYAEAHGYEVVGVWLEDFTGTQINRPEMNRVMQGVTAREIDVVICYKIDRLSRGGVDQVGYFKTMFGMNGARFESVTEPNDNSSMGQVLSAIYAGSASHEVEQIRERTRRGLRAKAKSGKPIGRSRPPFGLRYKKPEIGTDGLPIKGTVNAAYEEDPATIDALRWIFEQADEGLSLRKIAQGLDALGVQPSYADRTGSKKWNQTSVSHMLKNRCYLGEGITFAVRTEKNPDPQFKVKHSRREIDPDGDGAIPLPPGVYPVVIDLAQFDRVQARLQQNRRETQRRDRDPEIGLLRRGIVRCGHCNSAMVVQPRKSEKPIYSCNRTQRDRYDCPSASKNVDLLDGEVWNWIVTLCEDPRLVTVLAERAQGKANAAAVATSIVEQLRNQIAEIDRQRNTLTSRLAMVDDDTAALVARELARLSEQRKSLAVKCDELEAENDRERAQDARVGRAVELIKAIEPDDLRALSYQEKRRILLDLGAVVHLYPKAHTPRWGMTLTFDNDAMQLRAVGDENMSVLWDESGNFDDAVFYMSSSPVRTGI